MRRGVEGVAPVVERVAHERQHADVGARRGAHRRQHHPVGVVDLSGPGRPGIGGAIEEFVTARDHRDDRLAADHETAQSEGGGDAEACRREYVSGTQHHGASPHVVATRRDVLTRRDRLGESHAIAITMRALDHHDGIGAFGQRRTGRDVDARALTRR